MGFPEPSPFRMSAMEGMVRSRTASGETGWDFSVPTCWTAACAIEVDEKACCEAAPGTKTRASRAEGKDFMDPSAYCNLARVPAREGGQMRCQSLGGKIRQFQRTYNGRAGGSCSRPARFVWQRRQNAPIEVFAPATKASAHLKPGPRGQRYFVHLRMNP